MIFHLWKRCHSLPRADQKKCHLLCQRHFLMRFQLPLYYTNLAIASLKNAPFFIALEKKKEKVFQFQKSFGWKKNWSAQSNPFSVWKWLKNISLQSLTKKLQSLKKIWGSFLRNPVYFASVTIVFNNLHWSKKW